MQILSWVFFAVFIYFFFYAIMSNHKKRKRNMLKYDEDGVHIPKHLISAKNSDSIKDENDEDLTYEEMEAYCDNYKQRDGNVEYETIRWDTIVSWEYGFKRSSRNHTNSSYVWLKITTSNGIIGINSVERIKMKRYFKKYVKDKQTTNIDTQIEKWGIPISIIIFILFVVFSLFLK